MDSKMDTDDTVVYLVVFLHSSDQQQYEDVLNCLKLVRNLFALYNHKL